MPEQEPRRMTPALQEALDNITGSRRKVMIAVYAQTDPTSPTFALNQAIVRELELSQLLEGEVVRRMDADVHPHTDDNSGSPLKDGEPPWPQATGGDAYLDDDGDPTDPPGNLP